MTHDALNSNQRGGAGPNGKRSLTVEEAAAELGREGASWSARLGEAAIVTYSFRASAPAGGMPEGASGFSRFTHQQIDAAELALKLWAQMANITFVKVGTQHDPYSDDATILFGAYTESTGDAAAFAYTPGDRSASALDGDVWINHNYNEIYYANTGGGIGFYTLLHEIGHAIGLLHPGDYDAAEDRELAYAADAGYFEDSLQYTVMSYFDMEATGGVTPPTMNSPRGPLIDDIAAAQRLYGANRSTNVRDTTYGYNEGLTIGFDKPEPYLQTGYYGGPIWGSIWDAGGVDRIDFSLGSTGQKINLHPGAFSNVEGGVGNLSIAIGSVIENAYGGRFADTLIGNGVANLLNGGGGDDQLTGEGGDDTLGGEAGNDRLAAGAGDDRIDGGSGRDVALFSGVFRQSAVATQASGFLVSGLDGHDAVMGVERFEFADGAFILDPDSAGAQVQRLYAAVLDRAPDAGGLDFYLDVLEDRGGTLLGVAGDLIGSAEFQATTGGLDDGRFVDFMYQQTLGRTPDAGGKAYYTDQLGKGLSRAALALDFSESAEHRALTAGLVAGGYFNTDDSHQAVALLYDGAFGRLPDAGGLGFYGEKVKSGAMTLAQVAADFAGSAEFGAAVAGKSNGEIVDLIYLNTLDRAPDAGGRAFYTGLLDRGASVAAVFQDIGLSAEHYYLYSAHITNGIDVL